MEEKEDDLLANNKWLAINKCTIVDEDVKTL
jgi:hypothetical protein